MLTRLFSSLTVCLLAAPAALAATETEGHHGPTTGFHNLVTPFTDPTTNIAFLAFAIFVGIATYMGAFKYVGKTLDERAGEIQKQLDDSRAMREEAATLLADAERRQKEADASADTMIKQAKADAQMMVEQARKDLKDKVARREAQAEARIARAEADAAQDVRRAAADAATRASRDILARSPKRGDIFAEALSEIEKALN